MKHRLSITLDKETILKLKKAVRNSDFRNQSHFVETAIKKLVGGKNV